MAKQQNRNMSRSLWFFASLVIAFISFTQCASRPPAPSREAADLPVMPAHRESAATDPDSVATVTGTRPPSGGNKILTLMSWNVRHLGRDIFDSRQASPLLAGADVVAFQEVNKKLKGKESGLEALFKIAEHLEELTKERICVGLSDAPADVRERYGYLWRDSRVAYVKTNGEILENCPRNAITIRLGVKQAQRIEREPALGTFYFKPAAKQFVFSTIHLLPTVKKPQKEVEPLFSTFVSIPHPLILAGDFNLNSTHTSFTAAVQMVFQPAMQDVRTSLKRDKRELSQPYDNFWYRNIRLVEPPTVLNLYQIFTEKKQKDIYNNLSDHCPILGRFEFLP